MVTKSVFLRVEAKAREQATARLVVLLIIVLLQPGLYSSNISQKEKALQALKSEDYNTAIKICLKELEASPLDYDYNFLLARSYAFSNQLDQAKKVLEIIIIRHPRNADVLLLEARIKSWEKKYEDAELCYKKVLERDPKNKEAMEGMAKIASWQKKFTMAIIIYRDLLNLEPENPDLHFELGRLFLWKGDFERAKANLERAIHLNPDNSVYKEYLARTQPRLKRYFEVKYQHRVESFSDGRENYRDQELAFQFMVQRINTIFLLKHGKTYRFNEKDFYFGLELYPCLWKGAYGFVDLNYSSRANLYPRTAYRMEIYQSFLASAEFSLGFRRMNFHAYPVSIYLGSLGLYIGQFYSFFRWYYSFEDEGRSFSWAINTKRYFSKDNFVFLGYGQGSRPLEAITIYEFLISQNWFVHTGFAWYLFDVIRLQFNFTHRNEESGMKRNAFFISTGYRW